MATPKPNPLDIPDMEDTGPLADSDDWSASAYVPSQHWRDTGNGSASTALPHDLSRSLERTGWESLGTSAVTVESCAVGSTGTPEPILLSETNASGPARRGTTNPGVEADRMTGGRTMATPATTKHNNTKHGTSAAGSQRQGDKNMSSGSETPPPLSNSQTSTQLLCVPIASSLDSSERSFAQTSYATPPRRIVRGVGSPGSSGGRKRRRDSVSSSPSDGGSTPSSIRMSSSMQIAKPKSRSVAVKSADGGGGSTFVSVLVVLSTALCAAMFAPLIATHYGSGQFGISVRHGNTTTPPVSTELGFANAVGVRSPADRGAELVTVTRSRLEEVVSRLAAFPSMTSLVQAAHGASAISGSIKGLRLSQERIARENEGEEPVFVEMQRRDVEHSLDRLADAFAGITDESPKLRSVLTEQIDRTLGRYDRILTYMKELMLLKECVHEERTDGTRDPERGAACDARVRSGLAYFEPEVDEVRGGIEDGGKGKGSVWDAAVRFVAETLGGVERVDPVVVQRRRRLRIVITHVSRALERLVDSTAADLVQGTVSAGMLVQNLKQHIASASTHWIDAKVLMHAEIRTHAEKLHETRDAVESEVQSAREKARAKAGIFGRLFGYGGLEEDEEARRASSEGARALRRVEMVARDLEVVRRAMEELEGEGRMNQLVVGLEGAVRVLAEELRGLGKAAATALWEDPVEGGGVGRVSVEEGRVYVDWREEVTRLREIVDGLRAGLQAARG
ncbi:hypothetical protein BJ742DRAFT_781886 [Cladochytrium replicatum]|nr:hypothetical protein BJ742DRAFT_781886 [Cladochytrium replicatum]